MNCRTMQFTHSRIRRRLRRSSWGRSIATVLTVIAMQSVNASADTIECEHYFAQLSDAGDGGIEEIEWLEKLEAMCIASRASDAPMSNQYCNCPNGSRCSPDGNRCIPW